MSQGQQKQVAGVVFMDKGPVYDFDTAGHTLQAGDRVLVETSKGLDMGRVQYVRTFKGDPASLKPVVRIAEPEEIKAADSWQVKEQEALDVCRQMIREHKLPMKLVDNHFSFDGTRLTFFFTATGRVDFRALVRDLAARFSTRIELRQIGPRDEVSLIDTMGICGRVTCCGSFLPRPLSPSTKMARTQGINTRNTDAISGVCGRLKCCLSYEDEVYQILKSEMPRPGQRFKAGNRQMEIVDIKVIKQALLVMEVDKRDQRPQEMDLATYRQHIEQAG